MSADPKEIQRVRDDLEACRTLRCACCDDGCDAAPCYCFQNLVAEKECEEKLAKLLAQKTE